MEWHGSTALITDPVAVLAQLESYRREQGITHAELARRLGITYNQYCNWRRSREVSRVILMAANYEYGPHTVADADIQGSNRDILVTVG